MLPEGEEWRGHQGFSFMLSKGQGKAEAERNPERLAGSQGCE